MQRGITVLLVVDPFFLLRDGSSSLFLFSCVGRYDDDYCRRQQIHLCAWRASECVCVCVHERGGEWGPSSSPPCFWAGDRRKRFCSRRRRNVVGLLCVAEGGGAGGGGAHAGATLDIRTHAPIWLIEQGEYMKFAYISYYSIRYLVYTRLQATKYY